MKIVAGSVETLLASVKKNIKARIDEMNQQVEQERADKLGRARKQARDLREKITKDAQNEAESLKARILLQAKRESNDIMLKESGIVESEIKTRISQEIEEFIKGNSKINNRSFSDLVNEISKKSKGNVKVEKQKDGVVVISGGDRLELTKDAFNKRIQTMQLNLNRDEKP